MVAVVVLPVHALEEVFDLAPQKEDDTHDCSCEQGNQHEACHEEEEHNAQGQEKEKPKWSHVFYFMVKQWGNSRNIAESDTKLEY